MYRTLKLRHEPSSKRLLQLASGPCPQTSDLPVWAVFFSSTVSDRPSDPLMPRPLALEMARSTAMSAPGEELLRLSV